MGLLLSPCLSANHLIDISSKNWVPPTSFWDQMPRFLSQHQLSAISMAVVEGREMVWQSTAFDEDSHARPRPAVYEAGSLAKPMAAIAALQLQQRGLLDLDRPLMDYLPLEELKHVEAANSITTRHVLSHSSGLQNWRFTPQDSLNLAFAPGKGFRYSGEGYLWLQRIMEGLTGMGYARYVQDHILQPLGMEHSAIVYRPDVQALKVPGHQQDGSVGDDYGKRLGEAMQAIASRESSSLEDWNHEKVMAEFPGMVDYLPALPVFTMPNAAGSLECTAEDYARFLLMMTNDLHQKVGLEESILQQVMVQQVSVESTLSWGLGWGLEKLEGKTLGFHTGTTRYFKSVALFDPSANRALVIFTNGLNGDRIYDKLVSAVTGMELKFPERF